MPRLHRAAAVTAVCALSAAALLATPIAAIGDDPGIRPSVATSTAPSLVLNEIVYDDAATGLADQVEIYNAGTEVVDLAGWKIADERRDTFGAAPDGTSLAPGSSWCW